MEKKYGRSFGSNGSLYVGDKGMMVSGTYGDGVRIIPEEKHKATPVPDKVIPRVTGGVHGDFFRAVRGGEPACSNFETAARLTEMVLLGNLAIKAGVGKKLEWDGDKTNLPEINKHIQRANRDGWKV
jgi:hypothetical protein